MERLCGCLAELKNSRGDDRFSFVLWVNPHGKT